MNNDTALDRNIWPGLAYRDPLAQRDWLARLGFAPGILVEGDGDGEVQHSEMRWPEGGRVMISSAASAKPFPSATGVGNTYVVVSDPDTVYQRAVDLGAPLVRELREEDYGSRGFSATDPEGNAWSFGTYAG